MLCSAVTGLDSILVGDIVVFHIGANSHRTVFSIKRVAAVSGEPFQANFQDTRVPPGFLAVLGDNALVSDDSRERGFVPAAAVVGKVRLTLNKSGPRRTRWP